MSPSSLRLHGLDVVLEPMLDWQCYRMACDTPFGRAVHRVIAGRESYPQLVFAVQVKPAILELDPGPLDARVP